MSYEIKKLTPLVNYAENGDCALFLNISVYMPVNMASYPRRQESSSASL